MTSADKTAQSRTEFSLDFDLPHSPEKVWRALTGPALLAQWLLPVVGFRLESEAAFTFKTQAYPGWDGTVNCRMIEFETNKRISYTWSVPFLDTVVTFTLTPTSGGGGTRLTIMQSGFKPDQKQEFGGARNGWKMMGEKLVGLLGTIS